MPALAISFGVVGESQTISKIERIRKKYEQLRTSARSMAVEFQKHAGVVDEFGLGLLGLGLVLGQVSKKMLAFMGDSAAAAQKFELAQTNLKYALGATTKEMEKVRDRTLALGTRGIYSATELTDIIYDLASGSELLAKKVSYIDQSGKRVRLTLAEMVVPAVETFTLMTRGLVSASDAADTLVETINKLGLNMGNFQITAEGKVVTPLNHVLDVIAKVSRLTTMKPEQFSVILNSTRAAIAQSGSTFEDAMAIIATLQSVGFQPAQAGAKFNELVRKQTQMGGRFAQRRMYETLRSQMGVGTRGRRGGGAGITGMLGKRQTYWQEMVFGSEAEFNKAWMDSKGNLGRMLDLFDIIDQKLKAKGITGAKRTTILYKLFGDQSSMASFLLLMKDKVVDVNGEIMTGIDYVRYLSDQLKNAQGESEAYAESIKATTAMQKKMYEAAKETFMIVFGDVIMPMQRLFYLVMTKIFQAYIWLHEKFPLLTKSITLAVGVVSVLIGVFALLIGLVTVWGFALFKLGGVWKNIRKATADLIGQAGATATVTTATNALTAAQLRLNAAQGVGIGGGFRVRGAGGRFLSKGARGIGPTGGLEGAMVGMGAWNMLPGSGSGGLFGGLITKLKGVFSFFWVVIKFALKWTAILYGVSLILKGVFELFAGTTATLKSMASWFERTFHSIRFLWTAITTGEAYVSDVKGMGNQGPTMIRFLATDFARNLRRISLILESILSIIKRVLDSPNFAATKIGMGAGMILLARGQVVPGLIAILLGFLIDMIRSPSARRDVAIWARNVYQTMTDALRQAMVEWYWDLYRLFSRLFKWMAEMNIGDRKGNLPKSKIDATLPGHRKIAANISDLLVSGVPIELLAAASPTGLLYQINNLRMMSESFRAKVGKKKYEELWRSPKAWNSEAIDKSQSATLGHYLNSLGLLSYWRDIYKLSPAQVEKLMQAAAAALPVAMTAFDEGYIKLQDVKKDKDNKGYKVNLILDLGKEAGELGVVIEKLVKAVVRKTIQTGRIYPEDKSDIAIDVLKN